MDRAAQIEVDQCAPWWVLRTKHNHERGVEMILGQKRICAYLPKVVKTRQWSDRKRKVESPMIPGYIFVQPTREQFASLQYIPGSCGLIAINHQPVKVQGKVVDSIRIIESNAGASNVLDMCIAGKKVCVCCGPLAGVEGEFVTLKNCHRVVINVRMIGKCLALEVGIDSIRAID